MCGILGGTKPYLDYDQGIKSIIHRGPDGVCVTKYNNVVFAFARLSIIDLSDKAMQPMNSNDGKIHIVFNGEIYGYQKLRDSLKEKYNFKTTSDTEVILALYSIYGEQFIDYIDGMFAIAIYDEREQKIKLYRDRAGIKPLYYYWDGKVFVFGSEIKCIVKALNAQKMDIDKTAIYDYISYGYIPEPKSIYKNLYKLRPSAELTFDVYENRIKRIRHYWKIKVNTAVERKRDKRTICEEFRTLVKRSVKDQMVADVPVGCFLSGGIDSSIVTYECMKYNKDIRTFSIGFEEKNFSEINYVNMLVEQLGINADIQILSREDVKDLYGGLRQWYDEPFADTSAYPTYLVSRNAIREVKVVLTGDGSDELFGGYKRYEMMNQWSGSTFRYTVSKLGIMLYKMGVIDYQCWQEIFQTDMQYYSELMGCKPDFVRNETKKKLEIPKDYDEYWFIKKYYKKDLPLFTRMRYTDFKTYLPGDILTKVDRVSMANSLETRVPFLSKELIEFAFSLSEQECNENGGLKQMVKESYDGILPNEVLYRRKKGFSIPPKYLANVLGNREQLLHQIWKDCL